LIQFLKKPAHWRASTIGGLLLAFILVVLSIAFIDRFPQLDTLDELHNWVVQWTYARTGLLGDWFYRQMIPLPQPIYDSFHIPAALLLRFIGDDFWHARFARFALTCITLPFIYESGKILYGKRAGLLACLAALLLMAPTNFVRPDYGVGIMLTLGLYVFLLAERRTSPLITIGGGWMPTYSPLLHFLTGLLIGLGGEGHPLAYRFGIAFGLIYLLRWGRAIIAQRRLFIDGRTIALGMGGVTALMLYLAIHIIPGWEQGTHFALSYSPIGRSPTNQLEAAIDILRRQVEVWQEYSPAEFILFVPALAVAVFRKHRGDKLILFILLVSEVLMLLTYGYYRAFYQVHFLPLFALLLGKFLADWLDFRPDPRPASASRLQWVATMAVLAGCAATLYVRAAAMRDPMRDEFENIGAQLAATIPPGTRVVGNENYFLTYPSMDYYGVSTVATPAWFLVNLQGYALWRATAPDMFILSPEIDTPKYVPRDSIDLYMNLFDFKRIRCYTATGKIHAFVYARELPAGWDPSLDCQRWGGPEPMISARR
jgi:hypothetical protein